MQGASDFKTICRNCEKHRHISEFVKQTKIIDAQNEHETLNKICLRCSSQKSLGLNQNDVTYGPIILPDIEDLGKFEKVPCGNFYCQIYYKKRRAVNTLLSYQSFDDI